MTAKKIEPSTSARKLLRVSGVCGIAAVIVVWSLMSLALFYAQGNFNFTQNWLSDLSGMSHTGVFNVSRPIVNSPTTEILSRSGLAIGGILGTVFAIGLFYDYDSSYYRLGAVLALLGTGGLCAIGIFPEPVAAGVTHIIAGLVFFVLTPVALLLIGSALYSSHKQLGGCSIALGAFSLAVFSLSNYWRGAAEAIIFLALSIWILVFSVNLFAHSSHQI